MSDIMPHTTQNAALLIVTMEPPSPLEEEFNDWYDTEHFPQRRALPGFLSGSRWVCLDGWPRYLALYELRSLDALASPEYRAVSDLNSTPWSQRVLPRTIGRQRLVCVADEAQFDELLPETETSRLLLAGWPATDHEQATALAAQLRIEAGQLAGARQVRLFRVAREQPEVWLVVTFDRPVTAAHLTSLWHVQGLGATTFNLYAPYRRKRYAPALA
jgi:hypothetical protein